MAAPGTSLPVASPASAEATDASQDKIDSQAAEVLDKMGAYLAGQKSFQVEAEQTVVFGADQPGPELQVRYRLSVQRPNRLALVPLEGDENPSIVCDGSNLFVCLPGLRKYTRSPAPQTLDTVLSRSTLGALATTGRSLIQLAALAHSEPRRLILQAVEGGRYLGQSSIDGRLCHRLEFTEPGLTWQIWVNTGDRPLPVQIVVDTSTPPAKQGPATASQPAGPNLHATLRLSAWAINTAIPKDIFSFIPPASVVEAPSLVSTGHASSPAGPRNRPAPTFQADLIGGGNVNLTQRLGRQPVVLSFWVTWRRSSADTLAVLAAMHDAAPAPAWDCYLVNIDEPAVMVRSYLERHRIVQPVLLDPQGVIAGMYGINRTPCTVVIDAGGNIVASYEAIPAEELRQKLTSELARLAEGEGVPGSAPAGEPAARQESNGAEASPPRG